MTSNFSTILRGLALAKPPVGCFLRSHHSDISPRTWKKPGIGCIKLNFDGASKYGNGDASIGGVYRNHEGAFLYGYAERIGKATSSVAELVAAKRGLELALKNGWLSIWIEGDAKAVVDYILNKTQLKSQEDLRHARDISKMIPLLTDLNASHVYREGNKVADKLAKMGYRTPKPRIWRDVPPDEVLQSLQRDAEGWQKL